MQNNFIKTLLVLGCAVLLSSAHSCERGNKNSAVINAKVVEMPLSCTIDTDCTVVKEDCCSCNQGGRQRAIVVSGAEAWLNGLATKCAGTFCTQVISQDASCNKKAVCIKGSCELQ